MQLLKAVWALAGAAVCSVLIFVIHSHLLKEGQLAAGTCEIVTLDKDSSQPRRTIARQTARCACKKGQIAGTTRAKPACVDARIVKTRQWCEMLPCLEGEGCNLLMNKSGWTCTQPGGRIKTTTTKWPYDSKTSFTEPPNDQGLNYMTTIDKTKTKKPSCVRHESECQFMDTFLRVRAHTELIELAQQRFTLDPYSQQRKNLIPSSIQSHIPKEKTQSDNQAGV
ncbi:chemokine-like protein TAFA-5a isoform X3 [Hemiscyllium ocellatum]|uniref:chemokine-like protein TAFA-5a isoform X3 n=1 Tax=Hemiscyllium ocellatum TaxID=170820 RepID=UPI002966BD70|nr:chemokine-like protein TAFA-5a isoform X3 [Hemiscyllium ocellatum]